MSTHSLTTEPKKKRNKQTLCQRCRFLKDMWRKWTPIADCPTHSMTPSTHHTSPHVTSTRTHLPTVNTILRMVVPINQAVLHLLTRPLESPTVLVALALRMLVIKSHQEVYCHQKVVNLVMARVVAVVWCRIMDKEMLVIRFKWSM